RNRLRQLEQTVGAREQLRQQIIERRVEELLQPERQWEAGEGRTPGAASGAAVPEGAAAGGIRSSNPPTVDPSVVRVRQALEQRLVDAEVELRLQAINLKEQRHRFEE